MAAGDAGPSTGVTPRARGSRDRPGGDRRGRASSRTPARPTRRIDRPVARRPQRVPSSSVEPRARFPGRCGRPSDRALSRPRDVQHVLGPAERDVQEPALLGERVGVTVAHEIGTRPASSPVTNTTCHSRPLARWNVRRSTAATAAAAVARSRVARSSHATKPATLPGRARPRGTRGRAEQRVAVLASLRVAERVEVVVSASIRRARSRRCVGREVGERDRPKLRRRRATRPPVRLRAARRAASRTDGPLDEPAARAGDRNGMPRRGQRGLEQRRLRVGPEQHADAVHRARRS